MTPCTWQTSHVCSTSPPSVVPPWICARAHLVCFSPSSQEKVACVRVDMSPETPGGSSTVETFLWWRGGGFPPSWHLVPRTNLPCLKGTIWVGKGGIELEQHNLPEVLPSSGQLPQGCEGKSYMCSSCSHGCHQVLQSAHLWELNPFGCYCPPLSLFRNSQPSNS